jgi:hypothetical protein
VRRPLSAPSTPPREKHLWDRQGSIAALLDSRPNTPSANNWPGVTGRVPTCQLVALSSLCCVHIVWRALLRTSSAGAPCRQPAGSRALSTDSWRCAGQPRPLRCHVTSASRAVRLPRFVARAQALVLACPAGSAAVLAACLPPVHTAPLPSPAAANGSGALDSAAGGGLVLPCVVLHVCEASCVDCSSLTQHRSASRGPLPGSHAPGPHGAHFMCHCAASISLSAFRVSGLHIRARRAPEALQPWPATSPQSPCLLPWLACALCHCPAAAGGNCRRRQLHMVATTGA